jgi:uncharacterized membrane protein
MVGLFAAFLAALSTTLIKRLSATEEALTILVYFGLFSSILTAIPAYFVWRPLRGDELALLALIGALGAVGQFCQVRAFAVGELMAVAPIDYSRLVFAGIMGFLLFAELPDRYTLVGAAMIVGSTLYIAYRETHLRCTVPCSRYGRSLRTRRTPMRRNLVLTRPPVTRLAHCRRRHCAVERQPVFWRGLPRRRSMKARPRVSRSIAIAASSTPKGRSRRRPHVFRAKGTTVFQTAPFELSGSSPPRERPGFETPAYPAQGVGCAAACIGLEIEALAGRSPRELPTASSFALSVDERVLFNQPMLAIAIALTIAATECGGLLRGQGVY